MQQKRGLFWRRASAGALVLGLVALGSPAVSAATYSHGEGRYSFDYPSAWAVRSSPGVDVAVVGPSEGGFGPNIVAQHGAEAGVQASEAWMLFYAQTTFDSVRAELNVTEIQAPRTFRAGSGRLAADYAFERDEGGVLLRQRQVLFVSAAHALGYALTFTDKASTYGNHEANWSLAVDSFAVSGETAAPGSGGALPIGMIVLVAGAVAVAAAVIFAVVVGRKRRRPAREMAPARGPQPARPVEPATPWRSEPLESPGGWLPVPSARPESQGGPVPGARGRTSPGSQPSPEGEAPPMSLGVAPVGPAARGAAPLAATSTVRCPRCRRQFAAPRSRPAAVQCPSCGAKGTLR